MSGVSVTYGIMALMAQQTETGTPLRGAGVSGNRISARIAAVSPSATLAVDAKAKALQAQGESVIGFGAGEPDFPTPATVVAAAEAACRDPRNHRYTPTAGLPELREAVAAKTARDSGFEVGAAQVLITNGGKQAVANTFAVLCDPGDEVLVPAPTGRPTPRRSPWPAGSPSWSPPVRRAGSGSAWSSSRRPAPRPPRCCSSSRRRTPRVPCTRGRRSRRSGTGPPGTASGSSPTRSTSTSSTAWPHHSMPVVVPELAERCVVVNGVAKTYAMTGWRVGWMLGPPDVVAAATNLQSHETSNVANVSQRAALAAVSGDLSAVAMMREAFDRRRLTMHRMLNEIDGVSCLLPEGAFYAFPSVEGLCGRDLPGPHLPVERRAGRSGHRGGQGGRGPRRGLRGAGLLPALLRPGRRRPGGGDPPPRRPVRRELTSRLADPASGRHAVRGGGPHPDAPPPLPSGRRRPLRPRRRAPATHDPQPKGTPWVGSSSPRSWPRRVSTSWPRPATRSTSAWGCPPRS